VPVVVFVTPLAPRPASCRVVTAPGRCEVSRVSIRIIIPRDCQSLCSELSVLPLGEVDSVGGPKMHLRSSGKTIKMVFPAAIRGKSQRWVALSCDAHLVPTG